MRKIEYCHRCGVTCGPGATTDQGCARCRSRALPWDLLVRLGPYREPLAPWIVAMKFARAWSWGPWLGASLAASIPAHRRKERLVVCPVPMHWARRLGRGYNQAELLAMGLARQLKAPMHSLLTRPRRAPAQTRLPLSLRESNVTRCFATVPARLDGWEVWLVDDVKTTGSTVGACARLLRRAGAVRVNVAVAAVTD